MCFSEPRALTFQTDVFTIPFKDGFILYVPKSGVVAGVDDRVAELIRTISAGQPIQDTPFNDEWVTALSRLGVFDSNKETDPGELGPFLPTHATLSLTSRCHLRCIYCYARAGESLHDMPEEVIAGAIQFVAHNAKEKTIPEMTISFHGEGEPTANWSLFTYAVESAESLASQQGLHVQFTMSSNAMWSPTQAKYIAHHFRNVSVSFDGVETVQNAQRPTRSGAPSFPIVIRSLKILEQHGVQYRIRATVLPAGIESIRHFLDLLGSKFHCTWVHLEPVFLTGRAVDLGLDSEVLAFSRQFLDAYHAAVHCGEARGVHIAYSGCRATHHAANFCNATGSNLNFFVSTRGLVSSCYELNAPTTPKGKFTVYGHYDPGQGRFMFDAPRLNRLRNFGLSKLSHCRGCFARWNCSGDCLARSDISVDELGNITGSRDSPRCIVNRETTLYELIRHALVSDFRVRSAEVERLKMWKGGE